jgi:hypothetical protein
MPPAKKKPAPRPKPAAPVQSVFQGGSFLVDAQAEEEADHEIQPTLSMSDLDLDVSYVGMFQPAPQGERDQTGSQQFFQSPAGWTGHDNDLDPKYESYQDDSY